MAQSCFSPICSSTMTSIHWAVVGDVVPLSSLPVILSGSLSSRLCLVCLLLVRKKSSCTVCGSKVVVHSGSPSSRLDQISSRCLASFSFFFCLSLFIWWAYLASKAEIVSSVRSNSRLNTLSMISFLPEKIDGSTANSACYVGPFLLSIGFPASPVFPASFPSCSISICFCLWIPTSYFTILAVFLSSGITTFLQIVSELPTPKSGLI